MVSGVHLLPTVLFFCPPRYPTNAHWGGCSPLISYCKFLRFTPVVLSIWWCTLGWLSVISPILLQLTWVPHFILSVPLLLTGVVLHHPRYFGTTHCCGSTLSQVSLICSLGERVNIIPCFPLPLTGMTSCYPKCSTVAHFGGFMLHRCSTYTHRVALCCLRFSLMLN